MYENISNPFSIARLKALVKEHWTALLGAFVMALLVSSPLIAFPFWAGNRYEGINIYHIGTDVHQYLSRGKEVLEGNGLGQPYLSTGKSLQDPQFDHLEYILLAPFRWLGLGERVNVVTIYNIYNFVGVFLLTLAIYAFSFRLSKSRSLALATALFVIGGYSIIENKTLFYDNMNIYGRSLFPYAASLPFFLFLLAVQATLEKPRVLYYSLLAGALGGFLFFEYFYAWSFALAFLGALGLILLFKRAWPELRAAVLAGCVAVVLGLFNLIPLVRFYLSGTAQQLAYFWYSSHGYTFVMSLTGLVALLLFCVYIWFNRTDRNWPMVLACILAGWIALDQQLVTGRFVDYGHYYWYFVIPLAIVVGMYMVSRLIPGRFYTFLTTVLIGLALINTIGGQYGSFYAIADIKMHEQTYGPLLADLRSLPYGVVLSGTGDDTYPYLVTIYTDDDLYWNNGALIYDVPVTRVEQSLLVYLYLNKDSRSDPAAYLAAQEAASVRNSYTSLYGSLEGYYSGLDYYTYTALVNSGASIPDRASTLAQVASDYRQAFPNSSSLRTLLVTQGVRYILWDSTVYPEWDLSPLQPLKEIDQNDGAVLYELSS